METFSKKAFARLCQKLREAGVDSELVHKFISNEQFAMNQLDQATEEIDPETRSDKSSDPVEDFKNTSHFW